MTKDMDRGRYKDKINVLKTRQSSLAKGSSQQYRSSFVTIKSIWIVVSNLSWGIHRCATGGK